LCILDPSPCHIAAATFTRNPFANAKSNAKPEHSGDKKTSKQLQHGRRAYSALFPFLYLIRALRQMPAVFAVAGALRADTAKRDDYAQL